jgi:hypothetical protein
MSDVTININKILEENTAEDLARFINKRQCLNTANMYLIYFFHIVQAAGILTTTIATGYSVKELIWVGVGLNMLATLINIFEQTNNNISKKMLQNIEAIKKGDYLDEDILITPVTSQSKTETDQRKREDWA